MTAASWIAVATRSAVSSLPSTLLKATRFRVPSANSRTTFLTRPTRAGRDVESWHDADGSLTVPDGVGYARVEKQEDTLERPVRTRWFDASDRPMVGPGGCVEERWEHHPRSDDPYVCVVESE